MKIGPVIIFAALLRRCGVDRISVKGGGDDAHYQLQIIEGLGIVWPCVAELLVGDMVSV